jgi:hypothetical protein
MAAYHELDLNRWCIRNGIDPNLMCTCPLTLFASFLEGSSDGDLRMCYNHLFQSETEGEIEFAFKDIEAETKYRTDLKFLSDKNDDKNSDVKHPVFLWRKGAEKTVSGEVLVPATDDQVAELNKFLASRNPVDKVVDN